MRDPVHRVKAHESPAVPRAPRNPTYFGAGHGRLHQRPAAQNDERTDGVETEAGDLPPGAAQDRHHSRDKTAPIRSRKLVMLENGPEKMKIADKENGLTLTTIEQVKPFNRGRQE